MTFLPGGSTIRPRRRQVAPAVFVQGSARRAQALKEVILTPDGYKKLRQEIEYLSNDKRREIADRIRVVSSSACLSGEGARERLAGRDAA